MGTSPVPASIFMRRWPTFAAAARTVLGRQRLGKCPARFDCFLRIGRSTSIPRQLPIAPLVGALDANRDRVIDPSEIADASTALEELDENDENDE